MRNRLGMVTLLAALCLGSIAPAYAGYGHRGHGHRGHHHHRHYKRPSVVIVPRVIVPFRPYWAPYAYPPVVVAPPPVYVQPAPPVVAAAPPPPQYWYYCDSAQAYYPYVQQCPGGWRPVVPTPQ